MKTIVAGALGECVHVAGIMNFLRRAESAGWRTVFLGPAVSIVQLLRAADQAQAELVGVSYRGGHPASIRFCHYIGLDYVSCSGPRMPIARLAAAQARLKEADMNDRVFL